MTDKSPLPTPDLRRFINGNCEFWLRLLSCVEWTDPLAVDGTSDGYVKLSSDSVKLLQRDLQCVRELLGERWGHGTPMADTCKLAKVEQAIRDFHEALSLRKHGDVAAHKAINEIETALGLSDDQQAWTVEC